MDGDVPALIGVAAVTDVLIRWLGKPGAEHLADESLIQSLYDLRERVDLELGSPSD